MLSRTHIFRLTAAISSRAVRFSTASNSKPAANSSASTNFSQNASNQQLSNSVVPDVMVTFGARMNQVTFVSHPGVMAVTKLLELRSMTTPRAVLTQENVDAIEEFDSVLAKKAQIAVDHQLPINFADLEYLDNAKVLEMFLKEKDVLEQARHAVLTAPPNNYEIPECLQNYKPAEVPRILRSELTDDQKLVDSTSEGQSIQALQELADEHIKSEMAEKKAISRNA